MALGGDILIKLGADVAELRAGFDQAGTELKSFQDKLSSFAASVVKIGAGIIGALELKETISRIAEYGKSLQENAANLQTQAEALGLTTDQFQAYRAAAIESGQSADVITTAITKFNVAIGQAEQGSRKQIEALNDLGVKIRDSNGNLRSQGDNLSDVATKLLALPAGARRAADEVVFFGKAGQQLNPVLQALSESSDTLIDKYTKLGLVIDQDTVEALDRMQKQSDIAQQKIDVLFSKLYAEVKGSFVGKAASDLQEFTNALKAASAYEGFLDKLLAFFSAGSFGVTKQAQSPTDIWGASLGKVNVQIGDTQKEMKSLQDQIDKFNISGGAFGADAAADAQKQMAGLDTQLKNLYNDKTRLESALGSQLPALNTPVVVKPNPGGASNPAIRSTGAQPRDRLEEALSRLKLTQEAEDKALAALQAASVDTPLREIDRTVDLQRKIDETIAQVASKTKGGPTPDTVARVTAQVTATETARAKVNDYQKAMALADQTERQFGDGSVEANDKLSKLSDALTTQRVTVGAYNEALKQIKISQEEAALAARGHVEGVDALAAGFENAALRFGQANNSFQTGGQIFDATLNVMSDGLNQFVTTGTIQFDKLLLSFANMLAQMALKAAASSAFNAAFGVGGSGGGFLSGLFSSGGGAGAGAAAGSGLTFAGGGRPPLGRPSIVGEQGPELFVPDTAGRIVTASDTADALQGMGGSQTINQTLQFSLGVVPTVRAEIQKLLPSIADAGASRAQNLRARGGKYKSTFTR